MREPVSTEPRLLPVIDATDPALMSIAPAAPMNSIEASASGVLDDARFGQRADRHDLRQRHDGRDRENRRDERERHMPARIGRLTCRHADDVVAAERENQQQRRR